MNALIHCALEPGGVLLATIDMPDKSMNVFSVELMDALDLLMDRVDADAAVQSVVLTSGKSSFLAGADLVMVRGYTEAAKTADSDTLFEMCGRLGRQFLRLEASPKPWVAAVNGIALGGGMELAMACRNRLVTDDLRTQIGVPEVRWGLLPGAGGTQRLPRLAGFDAAMDMLLSGRSIGPQEAVSLGVFERVVPAAKLLHEALATARTLQGQPYDAVSKFPQLAQSDVPPHNAATVRAIATKHGVSDQDFADYPAYSAIIDSVLKGARLPLAQATALEMHQFLRLMFNPVAGNMMRALFLERLRAEKELAAPAGTDLQGVAVGAISTGRKTWVDALAKLKVQATVDASLPFDTLELIDKGGKQHRIALRILADAPEVVATPHMVLAPAGPYGRVIEIVAAPDDCVAVIALLATRLRCLPWRTPGPASLLQRLRDLPLKEQTLVASAHAAKPGAGDPAFVDVAACLAGVTPAWSGGPLNFSLHSIPKGDQSVKTRIV